MIGVMVPTDWARTEEIAKMPKPEEAPSARSRPRQGLARARPQADLAGEELSEEAIRAIDEGRADHAAGRTFTMAEIKRELGMDS